MRLNSAVKLSQPRAMMFQRAGGRFSSCGVRISEASAGDSVSEQKQEIAVATAMVTANCWKNCPEMPPRKAVGTNTAQSTSAIETSAPPTSSMVLSAASRRLVPSWRCRSTFSTTTMASSTTMPTARTRPNSVKLLIENPSAAITAKVPTSDTGIAMIGMIAGRHPCKNTSTTMTTSAIAS